MTDDRAAVHEPRTIPAVSVRVAVVVVACAAFALVPVPYALLAVGLAVLGAVLPASLGAWGVILTVGLAQLTHPAALADWRVYATLAVVHALHVLGGWSLAVPWRGRMHVDVMRRPARRWLTIQVPAQGVLAGLLSLQNLPVHDVVPAGAVVVTASICVVVIVVLLRVLGARR